MTSHLTTRSLAAMFAALMLLPATAGAVPDTSGGMGFGVTPEDSPKGYLEFGAKPGATVAGALLLTNTRRAPVKVALRAQDAQSAATGGIDYRTPKAGGVGRWLELGERTIELAAGETVRVPVTARVPADAGPGDHFAGVVAYNAADLARVKRAGGGAGMQLRFISRFAVAVRLRLPGDAGAEMTAGDAEIETTPSGASVVIPLRNEGQLLIDGAKGQITVSRDGRKLFSEPVRVGAFIPGGRIRHAIRFRGRPVEGDYRVSGFIHPSDGRAVTIDEEVTFGRKQTKALVAKSGQQAIRDSSLWQWIAGIAGAIALIALVLLALLLRRRPREAAPVPAPVPAPMQAPAPRAIAPVRAPAADPGFTATILDINSATAGQLELLPGIGRGAAARIVAYREEYGEFESVDALATVPGFDAHRVARLRGRATAG